MLSLKEEIHLWPYCQWCHATSGVELCADCSVAAYCSQTVGLHLVKLSVLGSIIGAVLNTYTVFFVVGGGGVLVKIIV